MRTELRWKLWLSEKAILVWARLMEEMITVGRSWAQYGVRVIGYSVALCFDLGFPIGFRPVMIRMTAGTRMGPGAMA